MKTTTEWRRIVNEPMDRVRLPRPLPGLSRVEGSRGARDDQFNSRKIDTFFTHLEAWFLTTVVALVFVLAMVMLSDLVHWWHKISGGIETAISRESFGRRL